MNQPRVVSRDEWLAARKQHLIKEKELTRLRDQLGAERRNLPWVTVDKPYVFDGPNGKETLAELFDGRVPDGRRAAWGARSGPITSTVRIEGHVHQRPIAGEGYAELMGW